MVASGTATAIVIGSANQMRMHGLRLKWRPAMAALCPTQIVPDAQAQFSDRQIAAPRLSNKRAGAELARTLQRVDAFIVRLNSDIVLYDEEARQELLEGTVLGRLISFGTFWLFGTLAL